MALAFDHEIGTNTSGASVSSLAVTAGAAVAQFDAIVFVCRLNSGVTLQSVADSKGNAYTVIANIDDGTLANIGIAVANAATALANTDTITGTFSAGSTNVEVEAACYSGFTNHNPKKDQASAAASGTSNSPASANITTTIAASIAIGVVAFAGTTTTFTAGGSFTKTAASPFNVGSVANLAVEWQILAATQTINATGTIGASRNWAAAIVNIYDQAAAGGTEHLLSACGAGH